MDSAFYVTDQHTVFMFTFEMVLSVCQWLSNYHPYLINLNFNTLKDRKGLRKSETIKKMGMSHLITAKTITSLEPKLFGEVGGGRPLQLCRWTYFAKIKSKRIIAEKTLFSGMLNNNTQ